MEANLPLYDDEVLMREYARARAGIDVAGLLAVLEVVCRKVFEIHPAKAILTAKVTNRPEFVVAGDDDPIAAPRFRCEPPSRIIFGARALVELDDEIVRFTALLLGNYYNLNRVIGPAPLLPYFVTPEAFPLQAIAYYSPGPFGAAEFDDGYPPSIEERLTSAMARLRPKIMSMSGRPLRWPFRMPDQDLPMPLVANRAVPSDVDLRGPYDGDDPSPYHLRLHQRLLVDTIAFLIGHEAGHLRRGDLDSIPVDANRSREDEVLADKEALETTRKIAGFDLRSVVALFSFVRRKGPSRPSYEFNHPFARDRVALLSIAATEGEQDVSLLRDINSSMAVLADTVETREHGMESVEGRQSVTVEVVAYSDLEYTASLVFSLEQVIRPGGDAEAPTMEAFLGIDPRAEMRLLARTRIEAQLALVNRVHPHRCYSRGTATILPGLLGGSHGAGLDMQVTSSSFRFQLLAPPETWLKAPDTMLAITQIDMYPSEAERRFGEPNVITYQFDGTAFDHGQFLAAAESGDLSPREERMLRLAAKRYRELGESELGVRYQLVAFHRLRNREYSDALWLARRLVEMSRYDEAVEIAKTWLSDCGRPRPGFHLLLAQDALRRAGQSVIPYPETSKRGVVRSILDRIKFGSAYRGGSGQLWACRAFDHAFIEFCLFGEAGPYQREAGEVMRAAEGAGVTSRILRRYLEGAKAYHLGLAILGAGHREIAAKGFRNVSRLLEQLSGVAPEPYIFISQCAGDTLSSLAQATDRNFQHAIHQFGEVLKIDPHFVPAYTELAKIAIECGEFGRAHELLNTAEAIYPVSNFVEEVRHSLEECEEQAISPTLERAEAAAAKDDYEEAIHLASECIDRAPNRPEPYGLRGTFRWCTEELVGAHADLTEAIRIGGLACDFLGRRGFVFVEMRRFDEALNDFGRAVAFARSFHVAEQMPEEDRRMFLSYTNQMDISFARGGRALAYCGLGQLEKAEEELRLAIEGYPNGGHIRLVAGQIRLAQGWAERAVEEARLALSARELRLSPKQRERVRSFLDGRGTAFFPCFDRGTVES